VIRTRSTARIFLVCIYLLNYQPQISCSQAVGIFARSKIQYNVAGVDSSMERNQGTKVPWNKSSRERKFHGTFVRKFHGTSVPWTFVNFRPRGRKFLIPSSTPSPSNQWHFFSSTASKLNCFVEHTLLVVNAPGRSVNSAIQMTVLLLLLLLMTSLVSQSRILYS